MNLTIAGRGFSLTEALKQHINAACAAIYQELEGVTMVRVVLKKISGAKKPVEKFAVSAIVSAGKKQIIVKKVECDGSKMYEAIKKIATAVRKDFLARNRKWNSKKTVASGVTEFATKLNRRVAVTGFLSRGIDRRVVTG